MAPTDLPKHDELADADDERDWDRADLGSMADAVAAHEGDHVPPTAPYDPARDKYLREG